MLKLIIKWEFMKRCILFFLFNILLSSCFGLTYNYYLRNELSGSYEIKNLENIPDEYLFEYSMQDNQIIGYFYNSSVIKFVDETEGNKVIKSTYFAKESGKILYEKLFIYGDDSKIKSFKYNQLDDKGNIVYETESFFINRDDIIKYNSTGIMENGKFEQKIIIDGLLSKDYTPVQYNSYGIIIDLKNNCSHFFNVEEVFSFDNYNISSKLFQNGKLCKTKTRYIDNGTKKYDEINFDTDEKYVSSKQYILNGSTLTQIMKTDSEKVNKYSYSKIGDYCFLLNYVDWKNSQVIKIEIQDEIVYVKSDGIIENIKYPINLFDFSKF